MEHLHTLKCEGNFRSERIAYIIYSVLLLENLILETYKSWICRLQVLVFQLYNTTFKILCYGTSNFNNDWHFFMLPVSFRVLQLGELVKVSTIELFALIHFNGQINGGNFSTCYKSSWFQS